MVCCLFSQKCIPFALLIFKTDSFITIEKMCLSYFLETFYKPVSKLKPMFANQKCQCCVRNKTIYVKCLIKNFLRDVFFYMTLNCLKFPCKMLHQ